jgi:uncharacterized Zn-binding protein involved in type VI secretion
MASLPPDQRAQMQTQLKQSGVNMNNGGFSVCVSPAMAKRDTPILDKTGQCQPASVTHTGNQTSFAYSCTIDGRPATGKGTAVASGDVITMHLEITSQEPSGATHVMQNDSAMTFLGADCGDVKPPDYVPPK